MLKLYKILLLNAWPSFAWTAFEMYILTLGGSQMLFYSVMHSAPFIAITVSISALFFVGLFLTNIFYKVFTTNLVIEPIVINSIIIAQLLHVSLLFGYEYWAVSILRIPICLLGLFVLLYGSYFVLRRVFAPNKAFKWT